MVSKTVNKNRISEIRILHANANGVIHKTNSIQNAAELYGANVITINETKQKPQKVKGFGAWYSKERTEREGGG